LLPWLSTECDRKSRLLAQLCRRLRKTGTDVAAANIFGAQLAAWDSKEERTTRIGVVRLAIHNERRKFRMSCFRLAASPLKLAMTPFASDGGNWAFPALA
jgi:hypothetical protein